MFELQPFEQELLDKLRAANIRIPARPQILQDIENLLNDDRSTERMISQIIARDASLTAEMFKLVNSTAYRRGPKIDSLEQAVRMLGRKSVGTISRSALLGQQLGRSNVRLEKFWSRCTDVATLCSIFCDQLERPGKVTPEQAYLAGLFHDCGVPVLMQHLEGYGVQQLVGSARQDFLAEDDERATSHCVAGLMIAEEWQLPDMLSTAIRAHHYVIADDQETPHATALLQLAIHTHAKRQSREHEEWEFQSGAVLKLLGVQAEQIDEVIGSAIASFDVIH